MTEDASGDDEGDDDGKDEGDDDDDGCIVEFCAFRARLPACRERVCNVVC